MQNSVSGHWAQCELQHKGEQTWIGLLLLRREGLASCASGISPAFTLQALLYPGTGDFLGAQLRRWNDQQNTEINKICIRYYVRFIHMYLKA